MKKYSFDTYCDAIKKVALDKIMKHKNDIIEPISWIKLQQGGQGGYAVTHITLNYGIGKYRDSLKEQSFDIHITSSFPTSLGDLQFAQVNNKDAYTLLVENSELEEDEVEELVRSWELPDTVLCGELWKCGHEIRAELINIGFKIEDDCVVCYGAEDDTWGWIESKEDINEYIDPEDLEVYDNDLLEKLAVLFYDKEENVKWFLSKAKSKL